MISDGSDKPIFFDQSGRRWLVARIVLVFFVLIAGLGAYYTVPRVLSTQPVKAFGAVEPPKSKDDQPISLADKISQLNLPVFGEGPLIRVVKIASGEHGGKAASAIYSKAPPEVLTASEISIVDNHPYAIERYGQVNSKFISLTFDDGPDATYTPEILDLLSKYDIQASFFEIGKEAVKYPAITKRIVSEGHVLGNHTFNHPDFDFIGAFRGRQEINQTTRVLSAISGYQTAFFRIPYGGNDDQSLRDSVREMLEAQRLGYIATSYQFDTNDWQFTEGKKPSLPPLDGSAVTLLLHDGGGNRSKTLAYLKHLIPYARAKGYKFVDLKQMYPDHPGWFKRVTPSYADKAALTIASAYLVWPHLMVTKLFFLTVIVILLSMLLNICLAARYRRRVRYPRRRRGYEPMVSVIVPAYNEERVLAKSVSSILGSSYRRLEVIVVDDGSSDDTWAVAQQLADRSPRVRTVWQPNSGKAAAINHGISLASGEIIISIDADTVFPPATVNRLVRHFSDAKVGAVAGRVKVGNLNGVLTRWQALDYIIGINIERNAQAALNAVVIVPGACGAWRKQAILAAGGYSRATLAEDCDLTLAVHRAGYMVLQDNEAVGYTESPQQLRALVRQRFRWTFGNTQAFWKHRGMLFKRRFGWLGSLVLPNAIFSLLTPIVFVPLLVMVAVENVLGGNLDTLLIFLVATVLLQCILAVVAVILARERFSYLFAAPLTRFIYGPIRTYVLYRLVLAVLKGARVQWNKLQRTGTVEYRKPRRATPTEGF